MAGRNLALNTHTMRPSDLQSDVSEEKGKRAPTLDEINRRALEIHVERGQHGCDLHEFLDELAQADRELRGKYNGDRG